MDLTSKIGTPEFDAALLVATRSSQVAADLSIFILNALRSDPDLDIAQVEDRLRFLGTQSYLVANPADRAPEILKVIGRDEKPRPYSLWVCVHGEAEAVEMFAKIGTKDFADNREKLLQTGFLAEKKPTAH